ncbi:uncharacterized protein 1k [SARS coronavirus ZJ0301]|uniref:Uncharacterized protein 1k n=1 Tax=SARS coronavirus ZJ0301 TaxID=344702 RepID=Q3S2D4_SARS|nr:uncharacterized protein 1k [SARS coronavirus ZJ0301]
MLAITYLPTLVLRDSSFSQQKRSKPLRKHLSCHMVLPLYAKYSLTENCIFHGRLENLDHH